MNPKHRQRQTDQELDAIRVILSALEGLEGESIQRVLDYVFDRLSISPQNRVSLPTAAGVTASVHSPIDTRHSVHQPSIRDLKEEKTPESSNQMAALVAYYLSDIAPENERKEAINALDLEKYFKQAGFKLPKAIPQALPNAAAAGYFDAAGNGLYRLNPVGYNLVVHGLPRDHGKQTATARRPKKTGRR